MYPCGSVKPLLCISQINRGFNLVKSAFIAEALANNPDEEYECYSEILGLDKEINLLDVVGSEQDSVGGLETL